MKSLLLVFILLFVSLIISSCNLISEDDPAENLFEVEFHFKNLEGEYHTGTMVLNGDSYSTDETGIARVSFDSPNSTHTLGNVSMEGTYKQWLIVRFKESGENKGQRDTLSNEEISISRVTEGTKVILIKISNSYDMATYKTYLEDPLRNFGMEMLTRKSKDSTEEAGVMYGSLGEDGIGVLHPFEQIYHKLVENTNLADPFKRFEFSEDHIKLTWGGYYNARMTVFWRLYIKTVFWYDPAPPNISEITYYGIRKDKSTIRYLNEYLSGLLGRNFHNVFDGNFIEIKSYADFTFKKKLNEILRIALNFDPGTRFYDPGNYPSTSTNVQNFYTPEQIVEIIRSDNILQKFYWDEIDPDTLRFSNSFINRIFENKVITNICGEGKIESMIHEIEDVLLNSKKVDN